MNKQKRDGRIFIWVIGSVLFAVIIHCLFSTAAPNEWLVAKWSAGDILIFTSTVALGLLAVWQNKKFKKESDEAQIRSEMLAMKANELSTISKIIEYEKDRLLSLKNKEKSFIDVCNTEGIFDDLSDIANQPDDFRKIYVKLKMDSRVKQIKLCLIELLSELWTYTGDKAIKLVDLISKYGKYSIKLVEEMRTVAPDSDTYMQKTNIQEEFLRMFSDFICEREKLLNEVIYGNLTLEQIKEKYR